MEKKKEDEANIYKEMEQVGKNGAGGRKPKCLIKLLKICLGERAGKHKAFW